jgi:hypothetical protein
MEDILAPERLILKIAYENALAWYRGHPFFH